MQGHLANKAVDVRQVEMPLSPTADERHRLHMLHFDAVTLPVAKLRDLALVGNFQTQSPRRAGHRPALSLNA
jgi:hypothetical protein